ncbi:MAG TPA: hypothetical protein VMA75_04600 [Candidatus Paceibacterota bacterium]|nr:hypothetical protein [Candidatus Paceibacterota bacterium]
MPRQFKTTILALACCGILVIGFWNTINTAFFQVPQYLGYLSDEKTVGLLINAQDSQKDIFLYDWVPGNTIMFYSGTNVSSIQNPGELPASSNFLVVPTADLSKLAVAQPFHRAVQQLYIGPYLALFETR